MIGRCIVRKPAPGYYTDEEQKSFLRYYLEKRLQLKGRTAEVPESAINRFHGLCKMHDTVSTGCSQFILIKS